MPFTCLFNLVEHNGLSSDVVTYLGRRRRRRRPLVWLAGSSITISYLVTIRSAQRLSKSLRLAVLEVAIRLMRHFCEHLKTRSYNASKVCFRTLCSYHFCSDHHSNLNGSPNSLLGFRHDDTNHACWCSNLVCIII